MQLLVHQPKQDRQTNCYQVGHERAAWLLLLLLAGGRPAVLCCNLLCGLGFSLCQLVGLAPVQAHVAAGAGVYLGLAFTGLRLLLLLLLLLLKAVVLDLLLLLLRPGAAVWMV